MYIVNDMYISIIYTKILGFSDNNSRIRTIRIAKASITFKNSAMRIFVLIPNSNLRNQPSKYI